MDDADAGEEDSDELSKLQSLVEGMKSNILLLAIACSRSTNR